MWGGGGGGGGGGGMFSPAGRLVTTQMCSASVPAAIVYCEHMQRSVLGCFQDELSVDIRGSVDYELIGASVWVF